MLDEQAGEVTLTVGLERQLDSSLIEADVQPTLVRLLIKGRLLQLVLPAEVRPDASTAQRSRASGRLVLTMPKACEGAAAATVRAVAGLSKCARRSSNITSSRAAQQQQHLWPAGAAVAAAPPPLARGLLLDDLPPAAVCDCVSDCDLPPVPC